MPPLEKQSWANMDDDADVSPARETAEACPRGVVAVSAVAADANDDDNLATACLLRGFVDPGSAAASTAAHRSAVATSVAADDTQTATQTAICAVLRGTAEACPRGAVAASAVAADTTTSWRLLV